MDKSKLDALTHVVRTAVFAVLFLMSFIYLANGVYQKQVKQRQTLKNTTQPESQGLPVRLVIPTINVNAGVQYLGITPQGEMEVPSNAVDVGWFKLGSRPGEKGSAVIAGHIDGESGEAGVFIDLYTLKQGDELYIEDDQGIMTRFIVRESRTYDPGYAEEIFSVNDSAHLNLVTCDGIWDGTKKSYAKRLVVFADIAD